ncbi:MAG: hypothetical protein JSS82_02750 [Bacteroidetes bacterium]|nr:hypothetical protein [Bacteroidota bacterium]
MVITNRLLLLLLVFSTCFTVTCVAQKKNYHVVAVAFYNCENFFDTKDDPNKNDEEFTPKGAYHYTDEIFQQKAHNLATVLEKLGTELTPDGPAFVGVAEVENSGSLDALISQPEIRDRHYKYVIFYGPDERGINTGFIYNPKYFTVLDAQPYHVNLGGSGGKETTRDILRVSGLLLGDTVHVLVNHWPSRRGGEAASAPKRAIAAAVDRKIVDSLMHANPESRVFIMGDLNDDPTSPSVVKVLGASGDRNKVEKNGIYNPWVAFYKKGIGTLAWDNSWNLFDQIMFTAPLLKKDDAHWQYYKAEVFNKDFLIQSNGEYKGSPHRSFSGTTWINGYSDHFPTIVYLVRATN